MSGSIRLAEAQDGTVITQAGQGFVDSKGTVWALATSPSGLMAAHGTFVDGNNVTKLAYAAHTVTRTDAGGTATWSDTSQSWSGAVTTPPVTPPDPPVGLAVVGSPQPTQVTVGFDLATTGSQVDAGGVRISYAPAGSNPTWAQGPTVPMITPGKGEISLASHTWSIGTDGSVYADKTKDAGTYDVISGAAVAGRFYQQNKGHDWYSKAVPADTWTGPLANPPPYKSIGATISGLTPGNIQVTASTFNTTAASKLATPIPVTLPQAATGAGMFRTTSASSLYFLDPSGAQYKPRGVHAWAYDHLIANLGNFAVDGGNIFRLFPRCNFIRVHCWQGDLPMPGGQLDQIVNFLTQRKCILQLECGDYNHVYSQQEITTVVNWQAACAKAYASNPYVWFGSPNEPYAWFGQQLPWPDNCQVAIYNAIRSNGHQQPFTLCMASEPAQPGNTSTTAQMDNVCFDVHMYNNYWNAGFGATDGPTFIRNMNSQITNLRNKFKDKSGNVLPVTSMEFGNATDGANPDAHWQDTVDAVCKMTDIQLAGFCLFQMNPPQFNSQQFGADWNNSGAARTDQGNIGYRYLQ